MSGHSRSGRPARRRPGSGSVRGSGRGSSRGSGSDGGSRRGSGLRSVREARQRRWLPQALLGAYVAALLLVAFWPSPVEAGSARTLNDVLHWLHSHGTPAWVDYGLVESLANVALFLPFGLLVAAAFSLARKWLAVPVGVGVSMLFEAGQGLFLPDRVASAQDVLANGFGTALGTVLVYAWVLRKA